MTEIQNKNYDLEELPLATSNVARKMATITIPKKIEKEVKEFSGKLGISKEDFLINALLYYFQTLEKKLN